MYLHLSTLLNVILQHYFSETKCIFVLSDNLNFNYNTQLPVVSVAVTNGSFDENIIFKYYGCQGVVLNVEDPILIVAKFEEAIRNELERFNKRRYVVLPQTEISLDIFEEPFMEFIADFLLVVPQESLPDGPEVYKLYTHKFVGFNETENVALLDEWSSERLDFLYGSNLYPEKLRNAQGRTWKIATFSYKPYSVPATREGTELELSLLFCKKHNLTPYLVVDEEGEWGEIYDNWTGYGILGNVLNDNGDVGLAALYTWAHEYGYLDLSKPVVRTGITLLAPKPQLAGGWLVPLFSFTLEMWIGMSIAFTVSSAALFLIDIYRIYSKVNKKLKSKKKKKLLLLNSVLNVAATLLLESVQSYKSEIRDNAKRYFYGSMFIFSLLITSSYASGLASSMTIPRFTGAIKTVQDMVESGVYWGATSIAWIMSIMDAPEEKYVTLVSRFLKADASRLTTYNNKRFAFSVERLPAGYFAIGEYITESGVADLRLMTEDLYWEQCVLMTRKSSIWLPALDDFILLIAQSGIQSTWEYRVATTHLNANIQRAVKYSSHHTEEAGEGPVQLMWSHVQGAFGVLMIGALVSSCSFIVEVGLSKYRQQKRKQNKF